MSGNPAKPAVKKVYAYLLLDAARTVRDNIDTAGYDESNAPHPGVITMREDNPGTGTHPFIFEDGPIQYLCNGVYVGTGEEDADGKISFDYGVTRLVNLISAGAEREALSKRLVHEFADHIKERIEEICDAGVPGDPPTHELLRAVDTLEAGFFKVR